MSAYTEIPKIIAETGELPPKVLGDLSARYPGASSQSVEYFVAPPPLGDDENDGSEDYPLATIAAATARIPDLVRRGHTYRIILKPGNYPERVVVQGTTIEGAVTIEGETTDRTRYMIESAFINNIQGNLTLQNMKSTIEGEGTRSFEFRAAGPHMQLLNVEVTPDEGGPQPNSRGLLADYGSTVRVSESDFSGKRYGVRSNYQSQIFLTSSNTGTGNDIGVAARWGGKLSAYYGGLPSGETPMSTNSGGLITLGHGQILGDLDEIGLIRYDNYRDQGVTSKTWLASRDTIPNHWIADQDIPEGSTIRFRFRAPQDNTQYKIHVDWLSRPGLTSTQSVETKTTIFMRGNEIIHDQTDVVHSYSMPSNPVSVTARGRLLDFYLDITGVQARQGEWTAKISIDTSLGKTPILAAAELF